MPDIDVDQLVGDIKNAASQVLSQDVAELEGFSESQAKAIARQAAYVGAGILAGEITEETKEFFLDGLKDMALNLVRTLVGMIEVTIEKMWNAIVAVVWKAIETATGMALPV